ncbi:hypothetical protein AN6027.2 [Aspergillus nidulans FGSC A4]|uniref:Amino acid transporter transmembrane domain-containing protein n=1 Tax=Emericella nidulans (strain FGSC A4 / ATCC 38163 / CBS 112.46 / NRRL 194 / M139) TaxID=227321 RepID=Q5B0A3_EMENI|nr:hypothetical protein [Aspergillus nidulans FGSC A4]EAA57668.1 hypothetical protein AN6027.2 [Aspergillus nidulans FGSC A4]CBF70332.1 TPA: conserved hypothetical protein [Aspergillus nidulans FGSC A4]|eukprot:XP_663631.1 hypothetical protein AN6027.2 [Aspergillus nidulans FGSC A4]
MSSESKMKQEPEDLALAQDTSTLGTGEIQPHLATAHDDVFGSISADGPNYRDVCCRSIYSSLSRRMQLTGGTGRLARHRRPDNEDAGRLGHPLDPVCIDTLGLIPGLICMLTIAVITTWSDYMIGVFKLNHREVYSIADAVGLMFGRVGRLFFRGAFVLYWIFVAGSGMLGISIGLNAVSTYGACTAIFVVVAAIIGFVFEIRSLSHPLLALDRPDIPFFTVTIAVGVQKCPSEAPRTSGP